MLSGKVTRKMPWPTCLTTNQPKKKHHSGFVSVVESASLLNKQLTNHAFPAEGCLFDCSIQDTRTQRGIYGSLDGLLP